MLTTLRAFIVDGVIHTSLGQAKRRMMDELTAIVRLSTQT
jgi:hypothetical protein